MQKQLKNIYKIIKDTNICIKNGFVKCERCGDQENTKDLDFSEDLKECEKILLNLLKK